MSARQRIGLLTLILGLFLIMLWGGPGNMTLPEIIRGALYVVGGGLAFVWPDKHA